MASVPARPPSQRRTSPEQEQNPSSPQQSSEFPVRTRSEDSQTVLVQSLEKVEQEDEQQIQPPTSPPKEDDADTKKCWICFSDSSEDTPDSSPWRDPCPCALVAHEACLLDWIADKESPTNPRNRTLTETKIECPQCKAEIKLSRPRDYLVNAVRTFERVGAKFVVPGAAATLSGIVYSSSMAWGMHSVYAIFGYEDGWRILRPLVHNATRAPIEVYAGSPQEASRQLLMVMVDHLVHWRLYVGLPLITPILILSRTSLADGVLPVLPIVFFASQTNLPTDTINLGDWPPSASFVFAILPYVRALYNNVYQRVWAEKEARWLREIQPTSTQNQGEGGDEAGANANMMGNAQQAGDDGNIFEVRIDGVWEEWEDDAIEQANQAAMDRPDLLHNHDNDDAAPAPDVPRVRQQQQEQGQQGQPVNQQPVQNVAAGGERRLSFSPTLIAETVIGALLFPTLAGLAGEALKLVLPASWTAAPFVSSRFGSKYAPRGLLQQKWGRSIVGGCLFVVCKDALMLYVRWKMAQMHRNRRIVDYDRKKPGARAG